MADHLTEEEQIEAIKNWWKENWLSVVFPIALGLAVYFGWTYWKDQKIAQAESASDKYAVIIDQLEQLQQAQTGAELNDAQKAKMRDAAKALVEDYPDSRYARLSELMLARLAVEEAEYESAISSLQSVIDNTKDDALVKLAQARLARVYLANEQYDEALTAIPANLNEENKAFFAEIRGDIYVAQGKSALAHTAYQTAIDSLQADQFSRRGLLSLKLNNTKATEAAQPESEVSQNMDAEDTGGVEGSAEGLSDGAEASELSEEVE